MSPTDPFAQFLEAFASAPELGFDIRAARSRRQPLAAGQRLGGRYELVTRLGQGTSAEVWEGRDDDGSRVALKIQRTTSGAAFLGDAAERFRREGWVLARLAHPNIVRLLDAGEDPAEGGRYMVMELLRGTPLLTSVPSARRLLEWFDQLLDALGYLHARGLVHRDLKPDNIYVEAGRRIKLLDLGVARPNRAMLHWNSLERSLTRSAVHVGTPLYMSPEQAAGDSAAVGPASDLYTVGVMLFEGLCGRPPFEPSEGHPRPREALLEQHLRRSMPCPTFIHALPDRCRPLLEAMLAALLAKPYRERPECAADVRAALASILALFPTESSAGEKQANWSLSSKPKDEVGAGRGLTLIGRVSEAKLLMRYAREVVQRGQPMTVVLSGEEGLGKRRLARWVVEELHKQGWARVLRLDLSGAASLHEALHEAVYQHLRRPTLLASELSARLVLEPTTLAVRFMLGEDVLLNETSALLAHLTREPSAKLLLLWLDGNLFGDDVGRWLSGLMSTSAPIFVVWSCSAGVPPSARTSVVSMPLAPLDQESLKRLADVWAPEAMLEVVEGAVERCKGNPGHLRRILKCVEVDDAP